MDANQPLEELIFDRLAADGVPDSTAELVLAALSGEDELAAALAGRPTTLNVTPTHTGPHQHVYLSSVTVAGFRGVGPERTLSLRPRPGLTLVIGRNGSGKSSFAEAIELGLTGDSARWADKHSVWRTGWRNLHMPDPCVITVELRVDGTALPIRIRREWPSDGQLTDVQVTVTAGADLESLATPLDLYRPFLTADDLSRLIHSRESERFDAIHTILGLDALTGADHRLMTASRDLGAVVRATHGQREVLCSRLAEIDEDRAQRAEKALGATPPDLDQLEALLASPDGDHADEVTARYERLARFDVPDAEVVARLAERLATASESARAHAASQASASIRTAELLRLALDHHAEQGDGPCPVCRTGTLDPAWRQQADTALTDLRDTLLQHQRASGELNDLVRRIRGSIDSIETPAEEAGDAPVAELREAVAALHHAPTPPGALAAHVLTTYPRVAKAAAAVRAHAADLLRQLDATWRPLAAELHAWLGTARQLPGQERRLALLKDARKWLRSTGTDLRDRRLAPFAEHSLRIWQELRQQSSVELGTMALVGTNTRRRVAFPVSVDGVDNGTALGVMSQGELHALGLATFLPRSCAKESPFRFVVIDDPVQSMDPAKVDGLARVLAEQAEHRQVIVFTHDGRLPEAVRRLEIDAEVHEVVRAEHSLVAIRPCLDPVSRYVDDARALALTADLPEDVRFPVVAELCRSALEAACHRVVWRVRLSRGQAHAAVEALLEAASTSLMKLLSLALFDDPDRGGEVLRSVGNRYGQPMCAAVKACRKAVHEPWRGDLVGLVREVERLAGGLR